MDEAAQASSILSKLETYEFSDVHTLFSNFLQPFSLLTSANSQNPSKKPSRTKKPSQSSPSSSIRSLAKTFLPFVNRSLSLLPKRLSESPKNPKTRDYVSQLLDCYKLCLDCLDILSPELSGKPYCVHLQRCRYVHCLMRCERYGDAVDEGFRVLRDLGGVNFEGCGWKVSTGELVPRLIVVHGDERVGVDGDFVHLIVDLAIVVAQSVSLSKVKDAGKYSGLLILLDEVRPWFRHLDASVCSKLQWKLFAHMKNAALFMVREVTHFKGNLVPEFCAAIFDEYTQLLKSQSIQGITKEEVEEFVKFVSNCSSKCRSACKTVRVSVAMHLYSSADKFSQDLLYFILIQKFHALGLYFHELCVEPNNCLSSTSEGSTGTHSVGLFPNDWDKLQDISRLLCFGKNCYPSHLKVYDNPLSHNFRNCVEKASISSSTDCKISKSFKSTNGEANLPFYLNALKFLCWPFADFVTSERKRIVMEDMGSPLGNALKRILEAFLEYSYLFPHCQQYSESRVEIDMIVLSISVACFTLSLKLNLMTEGSTGLVNYILSDKCTSLLRPQMLKYIIAMLHNSFVEFYRHEYLKEAFEALELCCRASWDHCLLLCEILVDKQKGVDGEISETMIAESVNEACKVSSLLMDIGLRVDSRKVNEAIYSGLVKWYRAKNLLGQLSCPVTLIKHWAKTQCKLSKNTEDDAPILGTYLLHCSCLVNNKISTKIVGTVLEQELLAYQEMSKLYPKFCQKMQMKLIDTLLEELYISSKCVQRSTILVKKGLLLRTFGIKGLDDCIQCLTEAIKSVNGLSTLNDDVSNQLAIVYCLRALSRHEADPKSEDIFEDIREAVGLWLRINVPCSSNGNCEMGCEYVLQLLYHIADLLSIKGNMTLHSDVLSVIVKVFKQLNVPLKKCLSLLWESRRVNHALCAVPINETFIKDLSEQYDIKAESLEFWISCFKDSQPLLVGLLQNFSFLSSFSTVAYYHRKHSLQSEISVDEVEEIALNLLSSGSVSCSSGFLAGYLYHDLSERLFAGGRTIEALFFAKEAHRLRGKLLQEHFSCSIQQFDVNQELGESIRKSSALVSQLSVLNQIAIRAWPSNSISLSLDSTSLTPWNVLRCYLESTLQVGIIHETLGNVAEAEAQFIIGKSISGLQCLPRFIVHFSSCLGKIYHGMGLLELANKELATSEQNLDVERNYLTCSRCLLMLESNINEQLGILLRKGDNCAPDNPYESSILRLISLEKSNIAVWLEGASAQHSANECAAAISGLDNVSRPTKTKAKLEAKRSRKTKKELETQATVNSCAAEQSKRVTRSRKLSPNAKRAAFVKEGNDVTTCQTNGQLRTEAAVVSEKITCQICFSSKLDLVGSLVCFIQMKWEFVRRRQILRLLIGLGKCQGALTETHRLHSIYSKCIYILFGGNDCHCSSSIDFDSISKEIPGDILVSERAEVLYNLCLLSLKALYAEDIRATCCHLCYIQMSHVVSFLKLSFVLSREIPLLFQKVSRLLALVFVVSASKKNFSSLISCKALSESYWAAYFHQASIGSHHDLQLLSANIGKHRSQMVSKNEGYEAADVTSMITDTCMLIRYWTVPKSTKDMESYVVKFFENLPSTTIVCMSILGDSYVSLLKGLMSYPSTVYGLILLSHFNADSQPAVVLLPINTILQDEEPSTSCSIFGEKNVLKEWHSPWGSNALVDDVAPLFKLILRGNYLSCVTFPEERTEISRELWWTLRENLDKCLHKLLRNMEDVWFGQWRYLLLGRWLDTDPLNCAVKEFLHEINNDGCVLDINESIVKIIMGGIKSINMEKVKVSKLFLETGCFIGSLIDSVRGPHNEYDGVDYVSDLLIAAANQVELEYCNRREPVVLVLDSEIQMLPWESIPVMRDQEVYRMPSVASIFIALQRRCALEEAARLGTKFPLIDPLDAFYLLNPSGDLSRTQSEFEEWFRHQNMQGKAGVVPSTEELSAALENHDLFLYFGHGSGAQYMPRDKIQKLESCSAILLMGCSSGSVNLNGCYAPVGTSLSYMLAGAPIVVANLWEVTDLDIDRFAKAALKSFLEERSMSSTDCIQCSLLAEAVESMSVNEKKGNPKKGRGKKKAVNPAPDVSGEYCYKHKLRAGYFVSQARKACKLPFLIGAAPVCYGVPTGIKKKMDI